MHFFKKFLFISFIFLLQLKSAYAEILLGNWILSNPVVSGKTSTWSAITKDSSFKSDVSISPSSIQVANHLSKNRLSELAINAVTQAIPDGTDFIIDSSNQQLKYNLKADNHNTSQYKYSSPFEYGDVYTLTQAQESLRRDLNEYPGQGNYFITGCVDFEYKYECYFGHKGEESDPKARSVYFSQTTNDTYDSNAKPQTTSLVNVATKVINLADQNNSSAVSYIAYVVKDLIQYDTNYRQSLEAQLNSKLQTKPTIELDKISTGRTIPNSLKEKLAMDAVKANPQGITPPRMPKMSDSKNGLYAEDGWVKRAQNVNGVEIHYVENIKTGQKIDFKFKD